MHAHECLDFFGSSYRNWCYTTNTAFSYSAWFSKLWFVCIWLLCTEIPLIQCRKEKPYLLWMKVWVSILFCLVCIARMHTQAIQQCIRQNFHFGSSDAKFNMISLYDIYTLRHWNIFSLNHSYADGSLVLLLLVPSTYLASV
jgi:hypothetical protein